jgi:S1-C subfamily serine protease
VTSDDEPEEVDPFFPPPPEDRIWRHPSELGSAGPLGPPPIRVGTRRNVGRTSRTTWVAVLSAVAGSAVTLAAVVGLGGFRKAPPEHADVVRVQTDVSGTPDQPIEIAEKVVPSVARVDASGPKGPVTGTAVVFQANGEAGYLITTYDLLDGSDSYTVTLTDHAPQPATFVAADRESDIAVLKVDQPGLTTAVLGRPASKLKLGEPVIAVESSPTSSPGRGANNVPVGLINGLNQRLESDPSNKTLYGMIKTNLRLTSEATGAPLIDASNGAVIGIITSRGFRAPATDANPPAAAANAAPDTANGTNGTNGDDGNDAVVRFATPIDYASTVADQLITSHVVPRAWLGVSGTALTDDEARRLDIQGGLKIVNVDDNSPADEAKLKVDDVLLSIDDTPITSWDDLQIALRQHRPDQYISLQYLRDGERQYTYATLVARNPSG